MSGNCSIKLFAKNSPIVLDATLRDGGYLNDWKFSPETSDRAVRIAATAGADVIEVGYLDDADGLPETAGCKPNVLSRFRQLSGTSWIAAMLRPDCNALHSVLDSRSGLLDLVRIPTQIDSPQLARQAARACREHGFAVSANLTNITAHGSTELAAAAAYMASEVDIIYLADSRGALQAEQVAEKVKAVQSAWKGPVGFHAHDNLGLALKNSQAAAEAGCTWLDGTICGLGMGGQNLKLEDAFLLNGKLLNGSKSLPRLESLKQVRESDLDLSISEAQRRLYRLSADRNLPMAWPGELIDRFGSETAHRKLFFVPRRNWFHMAELEPWLAEGITEQRVVRQRVYESQHINHEEADGIFYQFVKPVHEQHGAVLLQRFRDPSKRVIVQWLYASENEMSRIQRAVATDSGTVNKREMRLNAGLHGCSFEETILPVTETDFPELFP